MQPTQYAVLQVLFIQPSLFPIWASNSETKKHRKIKIGVSVPWGRNARSGLELELHSFKCMAT